MPNQTRMLHAVLIQIQVCELVSLEFLERSVASPRITRLILSAPGCEIAYHQSLHRCHQPHQSRWRPKHPSTASAIRICGLCMFPVIFPIAQNIAYWHSGCNLIAKAVLAYETSLQHNDSIRQEIERISHFARVLSIESRLGDIDFLSVLEELDDPFYLPKQAERDDLIRIHAINEADNSGMEEAWLSLPNCVTFASGLNDFNEKLTMGRS